MRPLVATLALVCTLGCAAPASVAQDADADAPKTDAKTEAETDAKTEAKADSKAPTMATANWHKDKLCRMVFLTVLEGLYSDGVPTSVVDTIIGKDAVKGKEVKRFFVFRCMLCHAVFDAFRTYRARPTFLGSDGVDTFPYKPIDAELLANLNSDVAFTRVSAMGRMVKPWIERKLLTLDLTEDEGKRILDGLVELAKKGVDQTHEVRATDPDYANWDFYGACQACDAIETVSRMGQQGKLKKD